jgi:ATP-binding cassette subfamily B protein
VWPSDRFPAALAALTGTGCPGTVTGTGEPIAVAVAAGHDPTPVEWTGRPTAALVRRASPGWCRVPGGGFVVVRRHVAGMVQVVTPTGRAWARAADVAVLLDTPADGPPAADGEPAATGRVLDFPEVRRRRRRAAADALAAGCTVADGACVQLRPATGAPLRRHLLAEGLVAPAVAAPVLVLVSYVAVVASWALAGEQLLAGGASAAWLTGWALLAAGAVAARIGAQIVLGTAAARASGWGKRRVVARAAELDPDTVFRAGPGWVLGRTFDVDAADAGLTGGGAVAVTGAAELLVAAALCLAVPDGAVVLAGLLGHLAVAGWAGYALMRRKRTWARARAAISSLMTEELLAHSSRLVQGRPAGDAERTRRALEEVERAGLRCDRIASWLVGALAPAWLLLALLLLALSWEGSIPAPGPAAAVLGVVLLAAAGMESLAVAADDLSDGVLALGQVRELLSAVPARRVEPEPSGPRAPQVTGEGGDATPAGAPVLEARDLTVCYPGRDRPGLDGFGITVRSGERILLTGPSGAGKSTAVAVLAGHLRPDAGHLQRAGRVVAVPQNHRNHLFASTLGFNLLLGRAWPPTLEDLDEAERLCRALHLGPLLDRMPGRLNQLVGETGWQLSDGELTRVYAARALLQDPDVVLLDETLSALDPLTAGACRDAIAGHARSLLLTHHP